MTAADRLREGNLATLPVGTKCFVRETVYNKIVYQAAVVTKTTKTTITVQCGEKTVRFSALHCSEVGAKYVWNRRHLVSEEVGNKCHDL